MPRSEYTSRSLTQIYQKAREDIPPLLQIRGPMSLGRIADHIREKYPGLCDDRIRCVCGKSPRETDLGPERSQGPEWKHRVRAALQSLKGKGTVRRDDDSGRWELAPPPPPPDLSMFEEI